MCVRSRLTSAPLRCRSTITLPVARSAAPKIGTCMSCFLTTKRIGSSGMAATIDIGSQLLSWFETTT